VGSSRIESLRFAPATTQQRGIPEGIYHEGAFGVLFAPADRLFLGGFTVVEGFDQTLVEVIWSRSRPMIWSCTSRHRSSSWVKMSASIYSSRWVHFSGGRAVGVGEFQIRAAQDEFVEDGPIGECAAGGILLTGGCRCGVGLAR